MKKDCLITVFSGYNQRAVIAFLRTCSLFNINYTIIAKGKDDEILITSYAKNVSIIRDKKELDSEAFSDIFSRLKKEFCVGKIFVPPTAEALNRFLLQNKSSFEKLGVIIPLVPFDLYKLISDKYSFSNYVKEQGLKIPAEFNYENILKFPIVAKPRIYKYDIAPIIINNKNEFNAIHNIQDYYFQEFITGESFYLLFYIDKNKNVLISSQQNFMQQADGKSIVLAATSNIHTQKIGNLYTDLLLNLNFTGFIMIELRKRNNEYYMIEANPRFWGPSQLFVDSGYNFFEYFLYDYGFINSRPNFNIEPAKYFWFGGMIKNLRERKMLAKFYKDGFKTDIDFSSLSKIDIYNRKDTKRIYSKEGGAIMENKISALKKLYEQQSKHSSYQILASNFDSIIDTNNLTITSRYEEERLKYIKQKLDIANKNILDIGGNTGYFSFECLNMNANHLDYYEGNKSHSEFVKIGRGIFGFEEKFSINNEYYQFSQKTKKKYDIALLLNVLHHIGDDYGDKNLTISNAKKSIICQLNSLSSYCKKLVFQLGFNWKGNRNFCLFDNGTKKEMIDFIENGIQNNWNIICIGIAEKENGKIAYKDLSDENISRDDSLGEFLNRPIFILESRNFMEGRFLHFK